MPKPVQSSEEQVLWFRARRSHLAGPGAKDAVEAARAILGAQAQQLAPALLALSQRTKGRPTAKALEARILGAKRDLVRTWGQRETLHVYDPTEDWAAIVAAREQWKPGGRRGPMPPKAAIDKAAKILAKAPEPITRKHLHSVVPKSYAKAVEERIAHAGSSLEPVHFAAGRLLWCLANRGDACMAGKVGSEQAYAARSAWYPKLAWPKKPEPPLEANVRLTRRYLATHGPATATDVAHHLGANVSTAKTWLAALADEVVDVACGDRKGLVALAADRRALAVRPPSATAEWPVRLLPLWDCLLMGHADKSWTVPDEADRKPVWRKAAYVSATVLARGRVVATWSHAVRKGRLEVTVTPLSGWRSAHAAGVRREAKAVSAHLELDGAEVSVD